MSRRIDEEIFLCLTALVLDPRNVWGQPTDGPTAAPIISSTASAIISVEDSCEYLDNGCPADFDIHLLLPHETSCRKFYFCVRGERVLRSCASSLVFNPDKQICDYAGNVDRICEDEDSSSEEESISEEFVEPEEIELLPNGCPVNYTISMYLPHEYYCNVYYQCVFGQKVSLRCPDGTHYNQEGQNCEHIATVNCQLPGGNFIETTTTTTPPTTPSFVLQPNGCPVDQSINWLVAHEECTKFYFCVWGGLIESNCPGGLYFNPVAQICDNPALAGCANDPCRKKPCSNTNSSTESTTISNTEFTTPQATDGSTVPSTIINTSDPSTNNIIETTSSLSTITISNPTTDIPSEPIWSTTIINTPDLSTNNPIETTSSSSTITISNPTTNIPSDSIWSTTTIDASDPSTNNPIETTSTSSTITISNPTTDIPSDPIWSTTPIDASDPSTNNPIETTSSSSTITISNPTTDIPSDPIWSTTIIDTTDPSTNNLIETTSSSSTITISNPTTDIPSDPIWSTTIIDTSDLSTNNPIETTLSSSTIIISNPTTNIPSDPIWSTTPIDAPDPSTNNPIETPSSSSTITISNPTTDIPSDPIWSTTIIDTTDPSTNNPIETTSSSSTITISNPTTDIPSDSIWSTTTIEASDPSTNNPIETTSSSSTITISSPTTDISTDATSFRTTIDTSDPSTNNPIETTSSSSTLTISNPTTNIPTDATSSSSTITTKSTEMPSTTTVGSTSSTSSTTEDSCEYLDNGCPVDFDIHLLMPHETSCRKFYYCVRGEKILRKCGSGLVFNPDIGNCVHAGSIDRTCEEEDSSEEENISEEYVEPEEIELLPNGCPVNYTISMYLPHEYYCNVYYQCVYGSQIERYCPSNTHFNPIIQICDHIINANCTLPGGNYITATSTQAPETTTKPIDLLPNGCPINSSITWMVAHEECTKFYVCVWGGLIEMDCPDGTHFNAVLQLCDNPATAGCKICKKPCCSGNDGDNNCDGNGNNNEESSNEDDDIIDDYEDDNDEENNGENEENNNNSNENESIEKDCDGAENEYKCIENKKCEKDCNTLPRAHQDCDKYWICYGKKAVLVTCAEGLHFNPSTSTCDYPCNAGCVRDKGQATQSNEGLKLFLPWDKIDEEMKSILVRKRYISGN